MTTATLNIPVFEGQGTTAGKSAATRRQALDDASTASGSLLLKTCYEVFLREISSLNPEELAGLNLEVADFPAPESLLSSTGDRYNNNPLISGTTIFLIQSLRYLAYVEATSKVTGSLTPFTDVLETNVKHRVGVTGFSSGIFAACVVASSRTMLTYLTHAVEVYRLAFWVGVRCQQYRVGALERVPLKWHTEPWGYVVIGLNNNAMSDHISKYHQDYPESEPVIVVAVRDETCITVSGRPDNVASFLTTLPDGLSIHKTDVDTLYHTPIHEKGVKEQVLKDVARQQIHFPAISDIKAPFRCSFSSKLVDISSTDVSLVEFLLDMLLTQPVKWHEVTTSIVTATPKDAAIQLLNFGPGAGLVRTMTKAFTKEVTTIDATTSEGVTTTESGREPIAIVGMAVNMPGAPNVAKLWEVLEQGINTVSEVPSRSFNVSLYNNITDPKSTRSMKAHTGNFIEDPSLFDNNFFRISPREAKSMDPQQRILLQTAYGALEDAGYVPNATPSFQQDSFGCYIGVATDDYVQNLRDSIDVYYSTGTLRAFLSGRISYVMKLSGPSIVSDTACSSSIVTIYQACRALANRDCSAALAGGVNVISSPDLMIGLDRAHFLSPSGQCKPFDASADGYSRSEGCGLFVLKRLSDAINENDRILGVIRGIEVNQSGNAHSITHPHAPTQMMLFEQLLKRSGVERSLVNVVEAHGTGTQAGDPNELESIRGTFAVKRTADNPLHITSVKANIGHLEAASGAAGLAKLILMIQHRTIPRLISLNNLNPRIAPLESDHTCIARRHTFWAPACPGKPRMSMLNNFGAAGSNGALLLEEFIPSKPRCAMQEPISLLFGASAKDEITLNKLRNLYVDFLESPQSRDTSILDIVYTSTARRQIYDSRLAVTASTREELVAKLKATSIQNVRTSDSSKAIFVFSGQGGQYLGMGRALYSSAPGFKKHIDTCHAILVNMGFPGVLPIIAAGGDTSNLSKLAEFEAYQASIFALEYALAQLWLSWGLEPAAVVGHSLGEYAALVIAGVLTLKSALFIVGSRVRLMVQKCPTDTTGMIAVNLGPDDVTEALRSSPSFANISISCFNSAVDCVLGGAIEDLKSFKAHLDSKVHCKNVILKVPYGYHTDAMLPISADLTAVAESVKLYPPKIPIVSNVTGAVVYSGDLDFFSADYFARHCSQPVQFTDGIEALTNASGLVGINCWIEIGPHPTTLPMVNANTFIAAQNPLLAPSLRKDQDPWVTLMASLATMYMGGIPLRWRKIYEHLAPMCSELPSYPFENASFWMNFEESAAPVASNVSQVEEIINDFSMVSAWIEHPTTENGRVGIFQTPLEFLAPFIVGHSVGDHPLCPASVYHELALEGARLASKDLDIDLNGEYVALRSIDYAKPLVYREDDDRVVRTRIVHTDFDGGTFTISSRSPDATEENVHCIGQFVRKNAANTVKKFKRYHPILNREIEAVRLHPDSETISTRTAYEVIFPHVVNYSKKYHTMRSLSIHPNGHEAYAIIQVPYDLTPGKFAVHPVFMDTMLHVPGFIANMQGNANDAFICSQVDSVKVDPGLINVDKAYGVYVRNAWVPEEGVVIADAYAVTLSSPQSIVAHFKRMHFRKVRLASLKRALGGPLPHATGKRGLDPTSTPFATPRPAASMRPPKTNSTPLQDKDTIRSKVLSIVAETCDIPLDSLDVLADLDALGVDSLMSIEIFGRLQALFPGSNLDGPTLSMLHTPAQIIEEVSSKTAVASPVGSLSESEDSTDTNTTQTLSDIADDDVDVKGIMASVLGLRRKDINDDSEFEALGLDSLTSIEALHALRSEVSEELPQDLFTTHTTVRAIQEYIEGVRQMKRKNSKLEFVAPVDAPLAAASVLSLGPLPVSLQRSAGSRKPPLFLIHDGSGLVNYYERISTLDRDVWGIYNPNFTTGEPWSDLKSMAAKYAALIGKTTPGPILIGGWSLGGVVAFEAARQLLAKGREVRGVLLIDAPSPVTFVPLSDSLIDAVVTTTSRSSKSGISQLIKRQFQLNSRMLPPYDPTQGGGPYPQLAMLRSSEGLKPPMGVTVPDWLADRSNPRQAVAGWESLVRGTVRLWDIPGNHFEPFAPANIKEVSRCMVEGCEYLGGAL